MNYVFKELTLHNFLSFGDATINLRDRGYCLVKGINLNDSDKAASNGAGKSTIANAICWVLTNETISGLKSNIENINTDGGCFVKLVMSVDNDEFEITRYKNHEVFKTDLKIILNGKDISGKGVRESENVLARYASGLTNELLRSVILLGQNLPDSFTKNTPSGRKELLEKLTHSDYMIQDVKDRIALRLENLNSNKRLIENELITIESKKGVLEQNLSQLEAELQEYANQDDILNTIKEYEKVIEQLQNEIVSIKTDQDALTISKNKYKSEIDDLKIDKVNKLTEIVNNYQPIIEKALEDISHLKSKEETLSKEINKLKNITDICPTCGQKIPNVIKPDTKPLEEELYLVRQNINKEINRKDELKMQQESEKFEVSNQIDIKVGELNAKLSEIGAELEKVLFEFNEKSKQLETNTTKKLEEQYKYDSYISNKQNIEAKILSTKETIIDFDNKMGYNNTELQNLQEHIDMINKINTVVKRDFRGYLLSDIINFIDKKSKEYCDYVFNSRELSIITEGNDINIYYCNKPFDNLSGGEKKKVDCIIQFAIRHLMSEYFDFNSNILFLDELFDELDLVGCEGLINLITNTLSNIESVFIISHHESELEIPIDDEIVVVKNLKGISSIN